MKSNKGFTLIEIIISVTLISIFATIMLNSGDKNKRIYQFLNKKIETHLPASIILNQKLLHNDNAFAWDIASKKYDIKNDNLRKFLKQKKYIFKNIKSNKTNDVFHVNKISVDGNQTSAIIYSFLIKDIDAFLEYEEEIDD